MGRASGPQRGTLLPVLGGVWQKGGSLSKHLMASMLANGNEGARARDTELVENFHLKCQLCVITDENTICISNKSPDTTIPMQLSKDHRTARSTGDGKMTPNHREK